MDAVGGEEAVVDALAQAVGVDRVAEVVVGVAVVLAQRRRGHADLEGGLEVFEDLAPVALVAGAAAVALVDDDQVEEVGRVLAVEARAALVLGDRLVDGEVHLAALDGLAACDLPAGVAERGEGLVLRVVDQDVAVGEVEDARPAVLAGAVPARVQSFQQIWNATTVLPVPVAIVSRTRRWPWRIAWTARLIAISW